MTFLLMIIGALICLLFGTLLGAFHLAEDRDRWMTLAHWWESQLEEVLAGPGDGGELEVPRG